MYTLIFFTRRYPTSALCSVFFYSLREACQGRYLTETVETFKEDRLGRGYGLP